MRFENAFAVDASIDDVYAALLDVERAASCLPGVQMLERTGEDAYDIDIRVTAGPISTTYRGSIEIVDRGADAYRVVFKAKARETRAQDSPDTQVQMQLMADDGATLGTISADVQLSDTAAALGQGIIKEVTARIVETFSHNLTAMLAERPREAATADAAEAVKAASEQAGPAAEEAREPVAEEAPAAAPEASEAAAAEETPAAAPAESDALPIAAMAGPTLLARLRDPRVLAALAGAVLGFFAFRRRR
jgi:carbon monoxide dehydrogenase subunit G